jgi:DNA primase
MGMKTVAEHLKERHLNTELHRPMVDEVERVATFLLYNLSGQVVGYQQYRPEGEKKPQNNPKQGKYFTYRKQPTLGVWGVESLHLSPHVVFVTEGVFDAARLTERGYSAVAVLSNNTGWDLKNWLGMLNRRVVAVCDNDDAGRKLAKFGDVSVFCEDHDLGDSSDEFVTELLRKYA